MPQVDQAETVLGTQLAKLGGQAAQVVAATERAVQQEAKLGRACFTNQAVLGNEGHARF